MTTLFSVKPQAAQAYDTRAQRIYSLMITASSVVLQCRRLRISNCKTFYGV